MNASNSSSRFSFLGRARQLGLAAALAAFVAATPGARAGVATALGPAAIMAFRTVTGPPGRRDQDIFSPETLKQMNRDILTGKRPKIVYLLGHEILGLRRNPKVDADFVAFRFDPRKLTFVQRSTLDNWIRSGANRILLDGNVQRYLELFPELPQPAPPIDGWQLAVLMPPRLAKHPVNTDCRRLTFGDFTSNTIDPTVGPVHHMPAGTEVILEDLRGRVVCGSFPHGRGRVFFLQLPGGADARRWELNFWHWALGLPVPGAAGTAAPGPAAPAVAARTMDTIALNDGNVLNGTVLNDSFSVQTPFARLSLPRPKIERITFNAATAKADTIALRTGDRFRGTVQKVAIRFRLAASGQVMTLDSRNVREIRFKGPASK